MATNHLIIGLGGTGGKILREYRKRYFEEQRDLKPHKGVFVEYLYVDSSMGDIEDRKKWKVLGNDVSLSENQIVPINGLSTSMLQNLPMYPRLQSFLTKEDVQEIDSSIGKLVDAGIGGQRRRLGRMLFANHLDTFLTKLDGAVRNLQDKSQEQAIHFHICAGLAGGTGSGSIVDTIAQIRKRYPFTLNGPYSVSLYLYVPEGVIANTSYNAGFYQPNGYASLLELNAMSLPNGWRPIDVSGEKDYYEDTFKRVEMDRPFEVAYLFSNANERGRMLNIENDLPKMVSDFIYHKTVSAANNEGMSQLRRLEDAENNGNAPENDATGKPAHARNFMSFGIRRIEYPETEIKEYMTYRQTQQTVRQMMYDFWVEGQGYGEKSIDEIGAGYIPRIKSQEERQLLKISDGFLTLSRPIEERPDTAKWKEIPKTWNGNKERFVGKILAEGERQDWIPMLEKRMETYFENDFRTLGVKKFYATHGKEINATAKELAYGIEKILFNKWLNGLDDGSLIEIEVYLDKLILDCRERVAVDFPKIQSDLAATIKKKDNLLAEKKDEWSNIGFFGKLLKSKPENIFNEYADALSDRMIAATRQCAYAYASDLLTALAFELEILRDQVKSLRQSMQSIYDDLQKDTASRCNKSTMQGEVSTKRYDPDAVVKMTDASVRDRDAQSKSASAARKALHDIVGGTDAVHHFKHLSERINKDECRDALLQQAQGQIEEYVVELAKTNPRDKVLGVNILDRLQQELTTPDQLRDFAETTKKSALTYLQFNAEETAKGGSGAPMATFQLSLPLQNGANSAFRQSLIEAFGMNASDVSVSPRDNEIILIAAKSCFPLRYVLNVKTIRQTYDQKVTDPTQGKQNRFVLHTETAATKLPSLFDMDKAEVSEQYVGYIMLAMAMGIITEHTDGETQRKYSVARIPDEYGDESYEDVGGVTFKSVMDTLTSDVRMADKVTKAVKDALKTAKYRTNEGKEELRRKVNEVLKTKVLASCGDDPASREYKKYQLMRNSLFDNELKLL